MSAIHRRTPRIKDGGDKAGNRMRETFENIGTVLSDGFTKGGSLIDTSDWKSHLDDAIGGKERDHRLVLYHMPNDD